MVAVISAAQDVMLKANVLRKRGKKSSQSIELSFIVQWPFKEPSLRRLINMVTKLKYFKATIVCLNSTWSRLSGPTLTLSRKMTPSGLLSAWTARYRLKESILFSSGQLLMTSTFTRSVLVLKTLGPTLHSTSSAQSVTWDVMLICELEKTKETP